VTRRRRTSLPVALAPVLGVLVVFAVACSSGSDESSTTSHTTQTSPPRTSTTRPSGPAADMAHELRGGNGAFMGEATAPDLGKVGYVQHEYVAAGTATDYKAPGGLSGSGRWTFVPDTTAPYRTRVLVRRPADASKFSGTVVVEWLNVSGGLDGNPDWTSLQEELTRQGDVWVGVSTQRIGVEGGPTIVTVPGEAADLQGKGLKKLDPARYGTLEHPGDGYSFDIYTQVARALRRGGPALDDVAPQRVIAVGESQSALALTTYYNGVQPLTKAFDGFLVHSRAAPPLPLVGPGKSADLAGGIALTPTRFRTDLRAPVLDIQTEGDLTSVLNSVAVRQPDTNVFRLWEVVGTAHADLHLLSPAIANTVNCGAAVNNGPMHIVAKAALHALDRWLRTGTPPPVAPRIDVTAGTKPTIRRNADGIALGGIRTPPVDVPVDVLSGEPGPNPDLLCILLGSTKPLPAARIAELYSSRADYEKKYEADADRAIRAGFVLRADRQALLDFAQPDRVTS
jgi:alpha/beta hydrolase family protein